MRGLRGNFIRRMRISFILAALAVGIAGATRASQTDLANAVQLSARGGHACVVTTSGGAKCWGSNFEGQLGGGPTGARAAASDVVGLTSGVFAIAAADGAHTCAIVTGGGVKCWGANVSGQLGDGTTTRRFEPVDVQGLPWPAVAITGGQAHTCAISAGGAMACWGANYYGQLGDGTTINRLTPMPVSGRIGVVRISASGSHTCAITGGGGLKCWGSNVGGQLGDGSSTSRTVPVDVVGLSAGVTSIATAADGFDIGFNPEAYTCATVAGTVKCWGSKAGSTPSDVPGAGTNASAITLGGATFRAPGAFTPLMHACVLTSGGGVKCWGDNYCGMVGDGASVACGSSSYANVAPAVDVVGLTSGVASVSAAGKFTCALLTDGHVKCWGADYGSVPTAAMEGTNPQTVVFYPPSPDISIGTSATVNVSSGGGSGNPVILSSLTPGTCSVGGYTVTGVAGGTCTIAADQAGSLYYDPAPQATISFQIADRRLVQRIDFIAPATLAVGGIVHLVATSTSGRPVTLSVGETPGGPNACSITDQFLRGLLNSACQVIASVAGDSVYAPASVSASIQVVFASGTRPLVVYVAGGGTGTIASFPAGISCGATCAGNFATSSVVSLTPVASAGATFEGWSGACSGTSACTVTMDADKTVTARFASNVPRLVNLSTRGWVFSGNDALIGGFIIGGTANKKVVLRARGLSLGAMGVTPALPDPTLKLVRSSDQAVIAFNEDINQPTLFPNDSNSLTVRNWEAIEGLGFGVSSSGEAAMLMTLAPGAYTAIVTPRSTPGIGLIEIFEVDGAEQPLINVSTRGRVGPGNDVMIAGFIIQGNGPQTVVVRGRGPSMAPLGVPDTLANPMLQLVRSLDQVTIAVNDNWQDGPNAPAISASGFAPSIAQEAAIMMTLQPGAYTAILSGVGGTAGTGLVEVFRVGN